MNRKQTTKTPPAETKGAAERLTAEEALLLTESIRIEFQDESDTLAEFVLLLDWLAYNATETEREVLYIRAKGHCAPYMNGVDEAIETQMSKRLDALRREAKR
jgi:hypothetical protein